MKLVNAISLTSKEDPKKLISILSTQITKLYDAMHGRIRFGTGVDGARGENIAGEFQVIADTGAANTQFVVAHTLNVAPVGFLVVKINKGGVVYYDDGATWDEDNIDLKCTVANATVTIFILK